MKINFLFYFYYKLQHDHLIVTSVHCSNNLTYFSKIYCYLQPVNRTVKLLTVRVEIAGVIKEMLGNLVILGKNSKNFYSVVANQTMNYCADIGKGQLSFLGVVEEVVRKVDPELLKPCPVSVIFYWHFGGSFLAFLLGSVGSQEFYAW